MLFFKILQHLLPNSQTFRLTIDRTLRKFFEGFGAFFDEAASDPDYTLPLPSPDPPRKFVDDVYLDLFPTITRPTARAEWLKQFGLTPSGVEATEKLQIAAAWQAQGAQDPKYLQDLLQTAGFSLFVHEWWDKTLPLLLQTQCGDDLAECGEPTAVCSVSPAVRLVRDPRLYTLLPHVGIIQCGDFIAQCGEPSAQCNDLLGNDPGYLVNETLNRRAPPRIPDDAAYWRFIFYVGGETFPDRVAIDPERRAELEQLILQYRPTQQWVVMLVDYGGVFDDTFGDEFE